MSKDPKDPSTTSLEYDEMRPRWDKMSAVLGGLEAMRARGQTYLPKHPREDQEDYTNRLETARFWPITVRTLDVLASLPFTKPVQLGDDAAAQFAELAEDIDREGNNLDVFAQRWFRDGFAMGLCWVLIDAPQAEDERDGGMTLADERAQGIRPYWVIVQPEQVISVRTEMRRGRRVVVHARIYERSVEADGFAEIVVERVRLLEPGVQRVYRLDPEKRDKGAEAWVQEGPDILIPEQDEVPLVRFCTDLHPEGAMLCRPPLLDLADQNIAHYQSQSDQTHCLKVARFPILAASGVSEDEAKGQLEVGPNRWFSSANPQGKFYYVEHSGAAIEAGQKDLDKLESQCASYGAMFLRRDPGNPTATARALDSAESVSYLEATAILFKDAVELAMQLTLRWMTRWSPAPVDAGSVSMQTRISELPSDQGDQLLLEAWKGKAISRPAFIHELKRRNVLVDDYDPDEDIAEIEAEQTRAMEAARAMIDIDPQQREEDQEDGEDEEKEEDGDQGEDQE